MYDTNIYLLGGMSPYIGMLLCVYTVNIEHTIHREVYMILQYIVRFMFW